MLEEGACFEKHYMFRNIRCGPTHPSQLYGFHNELTTISDHAHELISVQLQQ